MVAKKMFCSTNENVKIVGLASAVPSTLIDISQEESNFGKEKILRLAKSSGLKQKYIANSSVCTSDLCLLAAKKLIKDLSWKKESIDFLIFVSQTPDYVLPATACVLQKKLGLFSKVVAFDINLGCSGFVYGLWTISNFLSNNKGRGLLLVGDTISKIASPDDISVKPLFGDAGTATALEYNSKTNKSFFCLGTDGEGYKNLIVPAGSFRNKSNKITKQRKIRFDKNIRSDEDLYMNGGKIFEFTLERVEPMVNKVLKMSKWDYKNIDFFIFHQANKFMIDHLVNKMDIPKNKVLYTIEKFGNTSSASIPLSITDKLQGKIDKKNLKIVMTGFGVGYSFGAVASSFGPIFLPKLLKI
jgi:3-oxoacyl-[acyl-carrier-protein] synthase-3